MRRSFEGVTDALLLVLILAWLLWLLPWEMLR
jgi:hypothetical protein